MTPPYRRRRISNNNGGGNGSSGADTTHLLGSSVEAYLETQGFSSTSMVARIIDCWPKIVGIQIAAHAIPVKINEDELVVFVDHPAWATELRLRAAKIISELEKELGSVDVNRLKVHVRG